MIRIEEAIAVYNASHEKKITKQELGAIIMPEHSASYSKQLISNWSNGKRLGAFKPVHALKICLTCGVDPNFLLGWDEFRNKNNKDHERADTDNQRN